MRNMKMRWASVLALLALAVCAFARPEPNAFLNKKADSVPQLVGQVKTDDQVMSRYMRHFGMTEKEVVAYFQTLRLDTLKEDGVYLVYNVPENTEEVRAKAIFYKKGTKVWVDKNGGIVLKHSCGNPMARGTDVQTVPVEASLESEPTLVTRDTELTALTETVLETSATPVVPIPLETSALAFPVNPPLMVEPLILTGGGGPSFNPLVLLPIGTVPFILFDGGGGNEPVPEPCTMILLGAAALKSLRKKRQPQTA